MVTQSDISLAIRIFLGLIFLPSALGKLANRAEFDEAVLDYAILPPSAAHVYSVLLPWIELALSLALFAGAAMRLVTLAVSVLLVTFIVAIIINLKRGHILGCHCYGILAASTVSWGTVFRNIVLLVFAIILLCTAPEAPSLRALLNNWLHDSLALTSGSVVPLGLLLVFGLIALRLGEEGVNFGYHVSQHRLGDNSSTAIKVYALGEGFSPCATDTIESTPSGQLISESSVEQIKKGLL